MKVDIHDKIKEMWKQAIQEGKNPPPLSELLESFPKGCVTFIDFECDLEEKVATRLRNKVE